MKVLTVKTIESMSSDIQRDIHYILRMEHHTDYVFKDDKASQYSATITMADTTEVIDKIIANSAKIPEYTIEIDDLDMEKNHIARLTIKNGNVINRRQGSLEWKE